MSIRREIREEIEQLSDIGHPDYLCPDCGHQAWHHMYAKGSRCGVTFCKCRKRRGDVNELWRKDKIKKIKEKRYGQERED